MTFYWSEITVTKRFVDELAVRLYNEESRSYVPPRFESGIPPHDEVTKETDSYGKLILRMLKNPLGRNLSVMKDEKLVAASLEREKEYLINLFKVGRELFLEEMAQQGVIGTPQGEIEILQIPFKPIRSLSDLIHLILKPILSTILSGLVVVFTIIIVSCIRRQKLY